ncbi:MAG: YecH family protein [Lentisphaeraceae bacterium]|nr:YecH family protein [Lentisphaeraceae bacterium]
MTHAHEILEMLKDDTVSYTRQSLKRAVRKKFGPKVNFTNCSGKPYNFDSIFEFFIAREKVIVHPDRSLSLLIHNVC